MIRHIKPDALMLTVSKKMRVDSGHDDWGKWFEDIMADEDKIFYFRSCIHKPVVTNLLYVYLIIDGYIRYRCNFVGLDSGEKTFDDGRTMTASIWIVVTGPIMRPPAYVGLMPYKGFRGFRYSEILY